MKDNKGLSLVELIIVIAIIAVLATGSVLSINTIFGLDVKECTNELHGYLGKTKIAAMSKVSAELDVYKDATDGAYYATLTTKTTMDTASETVKIGDSSVTITYYSDEGDASTAKVVSTTTHLKLSFDRSSGAFGLPAGVTDYCEKITISKGSKESSIELITETGKYYVER